MPGGKVTPWGSDKPVASTTRMVSKPERAMGGPVSEEGVVAAAADDDDEDETEAAGPGVGWDRPLVASLISV